MILEWDLWDLCMGWWCSLKRDLTDLCIGWSSLKGEIWERFVHWWWSLAQRDLSEICAFEHRYNDEHFEDCNGYREEEEHWWIKRWLRELKWSFCNQFWIQTGAPVPWLRNVPSSKKLWYAAMQCNAKKTRTLVSVPHDPCWRATVLLIINKFSGPCIWLHHPLPSKPFCLSYSWTVFLLTTKQTSVLKLKKQADEG